MQNRKNSMQTMRFITYTAILSALAGILMSMEISLPIFPVFYKIDFSDVPAIIATLMLGPVSGACVELLKLVIKLVTVGTSTMYVGEAANLIGIIIFVAPLWFVYKKGNFSYKSMIAALVITVIVRALLSCAINAFITLPMYSKAMGVDMNSLVMRFAPKQLGVTNLFSFIALATLPFNLLKNSLNCLIGGFLWSRIGKLNFVPKYGRKAVETTANA